MATSECVVVDMGEPACVRRRLRDRMGYTQNKMRNVKMTITVVTMTKKADIGSATDKDCSTTVTLFDDVSLKVVVSFVSAVDKARRTVVDNVDVDIVIRRSFISTRESEGKRRSVVGIASETFYQADKRMDTTQMLSRKATAVVSKGCGRSTSKGVLTWLHGHEILWRQFSANSSFAEEHANPFGAQLSNDVSFVTVKSCLCTDMRTDGSWSVLRLKQ